MTDQQSGPLLPFDEHNQFLRDQVRPDDWANPEPAKKYNLVVVGAGTAGLVSAAGAAGLGAKVALVERELMGGDCLNVGCVPSKALIASAHAAAAVQSAGKFGVEIDPSSVRVSFPAVMERMRKLRAGISPHDSVERFAGLGVDVFLGEGKFIGPDVLEVDDRKLNFSKAVIATGGRPQAPPIPGLESVPYLTNQTIFSLTKLPKDFAVVGGGPIGVEMAQAFARLGSRVTLIVNESGVLAKEDPDASAIIVRALELDGVNIVPGGEDLKVAQGEGSIIEWETSHEKGESDQLLVAVGRAPNVESLGLDAAGVDFDRNGVIISDTFRTSNSKIFAAGDVCSRFKFTHAADFMARAVLRNALFGGRARASALVFPWCTYTAPEVAHAGLLHSELLDERHDCYRVDMKTVDRAILEDDLEGFVKVYCKKGSDEIVAATIVARNAGDMISQVSQAMTVGIGLGKISGVISPYPTQAEAIRRAGDAYARTRLTPSVAKWMDRWLRFSRR